MQTGEIKVIEDPPPNNQNTTIMQKPSDILITWKPDSEVSVSTYNGEGEIRIGGASVSSMLFGALDEVYGNEFIRILENPEIGGVVGDIREAKKYNALYFELLKNLWESDDNDTGTEINRESFEMSRILEALKDKDRGKYRCIIPSNNENPITHISKNGKMILAQNGFDLIKGGDYEDSFLITREKPNIAELDHDQVKEFGKLSTVCLK